MRTHGPPGASIPKLSATFGTSELLGFDLEEFLNLLVSDLGAVATHSLCEFSIKVDSGLQVLKETAIDLQLLGMLFHLCEEKLTHKVLRIIRICHVPYVS